MELISNVHSGLEPPGDIVATVTGDYGYYHYGCDNVHDEGWGCGYRTLQTMCSWIKNTKPDSSPVPSIDRIQEVLVELGDKELRFRGSKDWIGSFEVFLCIDHIYQVPCKIHHFNNIQELAESIDDLYNHFRDKGSPVMMGGETDNSSKGVMGVCKDSPSLLIVDPHYTGPTLPRQELQKRGWVKWKTLDQFSLDSFYNLCLPQITASL